MENSGTGATLMWTSKLSMAPELNSRCLNKLLLIDVKMKKITRFKMFWPGDPTLEWFHDKKRDSPPRYIYYISIIISYCLFSNIFVFIVALTTQETLQKVALSTKVEPFVFFTNRWLTLNLSLKSDHLRHMSQITFHLKFWNKCPPGTLHHRHQWTDGWTGKKIFVWNAT